MTNHTVHVEHVPVGWKLCLDQKCSWTRYRLCLNELAFFDPLFVNVYGIFRLTLMIWSENMYCSRCIYLSSSPPSALDNDDADIGVCGYLLVIFSILLMLVTLPISIWMCIKVSHLSSSVFVSHCLGETVIMKSSPEVFELLFVHSHN